MGGYKYRWIISWPRQGLGGWGDVKQVWVSCQRWEILVLFSLRDSFISFYFFIYFYTQRLEVCTLLLERKELICCLATPPTPALKRERENERMRRKEESWAEKDLGTRRGKRGRLGRWKMTEQSNTRVRRKSHPSTAKIDPLVICSPESAVLV